MQQMAACRNDMKTQGKSLPFMVFGKLNSVNLATNLFHRKGHLAKFALVANYVVEKNNISVA